MTHEREELEWLRTENALLRAERDILLRAATGFAEDANAALLRRHSAPATADMPPTTRGSTRNNIMTERHHVWLTRDAHQRLQAELAMLLGQQLVPDADRRRARIRQIRDLLDHAVVEQAPPDDGIAEPGMVLTVCFDNRGETETFLLGTRDGANGDGLEICSPDSPLGYALVGARQGERRMYRVPAGDLVRVTLLRAVPYGQHAPAADPNPIPPGQARPSASEGKQGRGDL